MSWTEGWERAPCIRRWSRVTGSWLLALVVCANGARAQAASLFGRVTDEGDAAIADAVITLSGPESTSRRRVLTTRAGDYQFVGLPAGAYRLRADRLGYTTGGERQIVLRAGERRRLDLRLLVDTVRVEGVVVEGRRTDERERARFESDPGVTARVVEGADLKVLPGLAEADVLRAVELLPGVVSTSDFSSAFNVRGGSADQNLILLDGVPIFNPFHLGGLFSVFNADAVARAELLAGGFGAEYGGRVSSVLNVESDARFPEKMEVSGGISLLATRLLVRSRLPGLLGQALGGENGSWFVSARRSYFDQLLRPVVDFPYHLTDLQGHVSTGTRGGGRVSLTGYAGADVLDLSNFRAPGADADSSILRVRWNWGNRLLGLRWEQPLRSGWTGDTRLGYSSFADRLGFVDFGDVNFASGIDQWSLHSDWVRDLNVEASVRVGAALDWMRYNNLAEAGGTEFFSGKDRGLLAAAYASVRLEPDDRWVVEPGLRLDAWLPGGTEHVIFAPRLALKRFWGDDRDAALKLAVGRYSQILHSLRDEQLPVSNDTWVLAGRGVPAVISDQIQIGMEGYWGEVWSASVEGYLRDFRGVTEFNVADNPNDPADDLLNGRGRSYGLDFLLRRTSGRLTGWTTVSLLRARRTLPDPTVAAWEDIPPEVTFAPVFDRRVDVDLVLEYLLPLSIELGARWNYGSPLPYTRPAGQYFAWNHNTFSGEFRPSDRRDDDEPPLYVVAGKRNAERYPPYHRLDMTLRRTFRPRWAALTPYLQVLNVYNRRDNVLFYFYRYDRVPPTRSGISMFPLLPAIGVDISF